MMMTNYHAKLYAHEPLSQCPLDSVKRSTTALTDLNITEIDTKKDKKPVP